MADGAVFTAARLLPDLTVARLFSRSPATAIHTQLVPDVADAVHVFDDLLGKPAGPSVVDHTGQRDLAVLHPHVDVGGVDPRIGREPLVDVFSDAVVGPLVVARAASRK